MFQRIKSNRDLDLKIWKVFIYLHSFNVRCEKNTSNMAGRPSMTSLQVLLLVREQIFTFGEENNVFMQLFPTILLLRSL
jgi:hypothetical protein